MNDQSPKNPAVAPVAGKAEAGRVLQVERRDFTQLVPEGRARVQSMRGFDDCYTDIVDYIIRCTHRIWDERDVGLIYSHYTHNCVAYTTMGTMYDRETHIRDTIQRLVEFPDRRGHGPAGDLERRRCERLLHQPHDSRPRPPHPARQLGQADRAHLSARAPWPTA